MIQRIVKLSFHPENTAAFEAIFQESETRIRSVAGCLHMEGWRDINDPTIYYTYSRWTGTEALDEYRHSDYFRSIWPRTKALFRDKPVAISADRLSELKAAPANVHRLEVADYHIEIGGVGEEHFNWLKTKKYAGWIVLVDDQTRQHCLPKIKALLTHDKVTIVEVPAGERYKHLETCQYIWEELFKAGVGRRWCMLNLGGGVIGDMGGFAASTFKRGIDFVQIPTTLLSQVDASVGGKLGIDFFEVKNSIGVFKNPQTVWIDPGFLATLSDREVRSGYAEVIKHALIADADQWWELSQLTELNNADWQSIIPASVAIKRDIVEQDPHERGIRKALNFGHTIGHAIESHWLPTDDRLLHGEAIAAGMIMEAWISRQQVGLSQRELDMIIIYILKIYGHQSIPTEIFPKLIELMKQDKKNEDARINFTLLEAIGQSRVNATATVKEIEAAMAFYNGLDSAEL